MKRSHQRGAHTLREIRTQADSWEGVFHRIDGKKGQLAEALDQAEEIVTAGCGSAFNVAHAVSPFLQKMMGKCCRPVHSSDLFLNPGMFLSSRRKTLAVVISRSGSTSESVLAVREAQKNGCQVLSVTCFSDSPMAREADLSLVLEEAMEESVTTTRSLTSMILCGYHLAAVAAGDQDTASRHKRLPGLLRERMGGFEEMGSTLAENGSIGKYAFVGTGSYYGLAREAQLKIKEMVLLPSDSYVSLDFQHGPMSNVDEHMLVSILVSDSGEAYDATLARNMKALGGRLLVLCDYGAEAFASADHLVELKVGQEDGVRDVLYMPTLQFMAHYRSMATGSDPDNPRNLSYHVEVEPTS
jgi:glucosamine--fructose-6-phosphate aminotransferase (isomerizing)